MHKIIRKIIAGLWPNRFPRLYSAVDTKMQKVPVQEAAYRFLTDTQIQEGDAVLDIGFGLGYGMEIMAEKCGDLVGIDVDKQAVLLKDGLIANEPKIIDIKHYDGLNIPYDDNSFDIVTCVDVIEHVPDYMCLLKDMLRVSRQVVFVSTPNRRQEYTKKDGSPKNRWHLREWSVEEFNKIIAQQATEFDMYYLDGPFKGPFYIKEKPGKETMALMAVCRVSNLDGKV